MSSIVIFDLDGCISDDRHRLNLLPPAGTNDPEQFRRYHSQCGEDPCTNAGVVRIHRDVGHRLFFVTARMESYRKETEDWLLRMFEISFEGDSPHRLLMRPDDCDLPSPALKIKLVEDAEPNFDWSNVFVAYDDRADVLDAYRRAGVLSVGLMTYGEEEKPEPARRTAIVTGAASGLGADIADALEKEGYLVIRYDAKTGHDVLNPEISGVKRLDVLVNCAGVNHLDWIPNLSESDWDRVMDVNVKGIFKMSQRCLPMLRESSGTILNIVSNAAHIPMRCSSAYNASKAAALMLTKQMARELAPDVTVFSVSPNKLSGTGMSREVDEKVPSLRGWTPEQAQEYQLSSLLTREETDPKAVAEFIGFLLSRKDRHKYLAGCDIPYGA